jgi:hypothetical protein
VDRGVYGLTPKGETALNEFRAEIKGLGIE